MDWDFCQLGTAGKCVHIILALIYHPAQWRKLIDFGTGTLGDMGVHIFDTPYAALELTFPKWAKTTCRILDGNRASGKEHGRVRIPRHQTHDRVVAVDLVRRGIWCRRQCEALAAAGGVELPAQGSLFVGEEEDHVAAHVAEANSFPQEKFRDYKAPSVSEGNHYHQWVDACLGDGETSTSFSYAGPLTGGVGFGRRGKSFPETKLMWDAGKLEVTNLAAANELLKRNYRDGFEVEGL